MRHSIPTIGTVLLALSALRSPVHAQAPDSVVRPRPDTTVSRADITRRAVDVFGDTLQLASSSVAADSTVVPPSWDLDVRSYETHDRVVHFVELFSGRARERITERLDRGSRYEAMIRAKLKAGGIPEDMYYLALIESGFDPDAYSKAAAVGMWQFMTSTARDVGMRVDWWVDERRDPIRSTNAAVRFIRDLRDQFGSLYLAAAAYNGGPGRVSRGMARYADDVSGSAGDDAFFVLAGKDYLKPETRDYVPQLIAAALIAKEPARYGMELHPRPAFVYDSVFVPENTPLAAVARAVGVETSAISALNPHLLRGMTPPRSSFQVRVPAGSAAVFDSAFAALEKRDRTATRTIETKKGDTPASVARAHGLSAAAIGAFNPKMQKLKSGRMVAGQALLIPTAAVADAARNVPDPAIEHFPKKQIKKKKAIKKAPVKKTPLKKTKRGERIKRK